MFSLICLKCSDQVLLVDKKVIEGSIEVQGQVEVLYDADVYITCKSCGNEITVYNE